MLLGTNQALSKFKNISLNYGNDSIEIVNKFKYLGIVFDPNLSWHEHVNYLSSNVSKRIGIICRVKNYLPFNTVNKALVFPYFDYCSPVWSNFTANHHNELQILQNKLARVLLHADIRTPVDKMMEDLNWTKLQSRWDNQLIITVFKCLKGIAPKYISSNLTFTHATHTKSICTRSQSSNTLDVPSWNISAGKRTFQYRAAAVWNRLPVITRLNFLSMRLHKFKSAIST